MIDPPENLPGPFLYPKRVLFREKAPSIDDPLQGSLQGFNLRSSMSTQRDKSQVRIHVKDI